MLEVKSLLFQLDQLIDPTDPNLADRLASLTLEVQESIKPPVFTGSQNQLKQMRQNYTNNKLAIKKEYPDTDDQTTSLDFWQRYQFIEATFKRAKPSAHELTESL